MRLAVAGASGFLGSALVPVLRADGHQVLRLVRRQPRDPDEVRWDPGTGRLDLDALTGLDGAINLAGAPIGAQRWTPEYKQVIRDSRVDATAALATALAGLDPAPRVLLAGSAAGYYGDTGTVPVDESAPAGATFLAGVARDTEAATAPAAAAGVRVAFLRTGIVLHPGGGSLARVFPLLRLGLGGPLGSGRQYWSWISLPDELRAIRFLLTAEGLAGRSTSPPPTRCPTGRSSPPSGEPCTAPPSCGCPPECCERPSASSPGRPCRASGCCPAASSTPGSPSTTPTSPAQPGRWRPDPDSGGSRSVMRCLDGRMSCPAAAAGGQIGTQRG